MRTEMEKRIAYLDGRAQGTVRDNPYKADPELNAAFLKGVNEKCNARWAEQEPHAGTDFDF